MDHGVLQYLTALPFLPWAPGVYVLTHGRARKLLGVCKVSLLVVLLVVPRIYNAMSSQWGYGVFTLMTVEYASRVYVLTRTVEPELSSLSCHFLPRSGGTSYSSSTACIAWSSAQDWPHPTYSLACIYAHHVTCGGSCSRKDTIYHAQQRCSHQQQAQECRPCRLLRVK